MEKVEGADQRAGIAGASFLRPPKPKTEGKPATRGSKGMFRSMLDRASDDKIADDLVGTEAWDSIQDDSTPLDALLDGVTELGEELRRDPNPDRVKAYKGAVRRFMARVVRDSFQTEERTSGGSSFRKRKKYTIIKVVDDKLESLAAEILRRQKDQLEILRRMDEIRGLLVDLMR